MGARKIVMALLLCAGVGTSSLLYALADATTPQVTTARFRLFTDFTDEEAFDIAAHMTQLHIFYGQFFNFKVQRPFTVRYFATKSNFDAYVSDILGGTYPHFVFLDYDDASRNELLIYPKKEGFDSALAHFSFVQFLEGNIPQAPLWIREGYARYVENSSRSPTGGTILFRESTAWLKTLKEIINEDRLIDFEQFFQMGEEEVMRNRSVFYPQAWGMVSFLIAYRHRGADHISQEINTALHPDAPVRENVVAVLRAIRSRVGLSTLQSQFKAHILAKESFEDLMATAADDYRATRLKEAERSLYNAAALDDASPLPYYYLGLVNYVRRDHDAADHYYIQALIRGAEEGGVYYALGLNALFDSDRGRAVAYFNQARTIDPTLSIRIDTALRSAY